MNTFNLSAGHAIFAESLIKVHQNILEYDQSQNFQTQTINAFHK